MNGTESDSYQLMRKIIWFLNVFAGVPYVITKNGEFVIQTAKKWFETAVLITATIIEIYVQILRTDLSKRNMYIFLADVREAVKILNIFTYVVDMNRNQGSLKSVFHIIKELDLGKRPSEKNYKNLRRRTTFWMIALVIASVLTSVIKSFRIHDLNLRIFMILFKFRMFFHRMQGELFFTSLSMYISYYLDIFVDKIRAVDKSGELSLFTVCNPKTTRSGEREMEDPVDELREMYRLIQEFKNKTNKVFSLRLLLIAVSTFTEVVFYTFTNIVLFQNSDDSELRKELFMPFIQSPWRSNLILINSWLLLQIIKLIQIIDVCHSVGEKGANIAIAIHELRTSERCTKSTRDELLAFSQEVTDRNPYFLACNFFRLDYPLISSMVTSTVMHIIILMQFQQSSDSQSSPIQDILMRL